MRGRPLAPTRQTDRTRLDDGHADRRWFMAVAGAFALSVGILFGALALYHLTGPHPEVTVLLRRLRALAKWLIPRQRHPPKWWW